MNELLGKLTNLSYEFFGVIVPGIVTSVFVVLFWSALGQLAPFWSSDAIPEFTIKKLQDLMDSPSIPRGIGVLVSLIAIWYFFGHILLWIARSGKPDAKASQISVRRVWLSLLLHVPKPPNSFDPKLQPLFDAVRKKFASDGIELEWRHFYPVVKSYLAQRLVYSLVATYQNKYTLHRSVTTASAVLFWFSLLATIGGFVTHRTNGPEPNWALLLSLLGGAILLVCGFSASYMYHWELYGNTIITESYSLLHAPKNADHATK